MTIHVTQEDIDEGQITNGSVSRACACPIARALSRALGVPITVGFLEYRKTSEPTGPFHYLPDAAKHFIWDADDKKPVEPFTFEIDTPPDQLREKK